MTKVIELEGIHFVRGGKPILDGVSWSITQGRHAVLLGANGSGKTTLLKVLTGYEWPTSGSVRVLGREFGDCDLRALRRLIGWVSSAMEHRVPTDHCATDVAASGFDASFGLYRSIDKTEREKARAVVAHLGLDALGDLPFGLMSQGEQKRTLIARALVHDPALLVLDEPCAGLDPASRADFLGDIGRLAASNRGPTIVLVTHHIEEVGPWVRDAIALRAGVCIAHGPVAEVITSEVLSCVFDRHCTVTRSNGTYSLAVNGISWPPHTDDNPT